MKEQYVKPEMIIVENDSIHTIIEHSLGMNYLPGEEEYDYDY